MDNILSSSLIRLVPRDEHAAERELIYDQLLANELTEPITFIGADGPVGVLLPWSFWSLTQRVLKANRDGKGPV